jgi:hypothetical protein
MKLAERPDALATRLHQRQTRILGALDDQTEKIRGEFLERKEAAEQRLMQEGRQDLLHALNGRFRGRNYDDIVAFVEEDGVLSKKQKSLCKDIIEHAALELALQMAQDGKYETEGDIDTLETFLHHAVRSSRSHAVRTALDAPIAERLIELAETDPREAFKRAAVLASNSEGKRSIHEAMDLLTFGYVQQIRVQDMQEVYEYQDLLKHCTSSRMTRWRMGAALRRGNKRTPNKEARHVSSAVGLAPSLVIHRGQQAGDEAFEATPSRRELDPAEREAAIQRKKYEILVNASGDYRSTLEEAGIESVLAVAEILEKDNTALAEATVRACEFSVQTPSALVAGVQAARDHLEYDTGLYL